MFAVGGFLYGRYIILGDVYVWYRRRLVCWDDKFYMGGGLPSYGVVAFMVSPGDVVVDVLFSVVIPSGVPVLVWLSV